MAAMGVHGPQSRNNGVALCREIFFAQPIAISLAILYMGIPGAIAPGLSPPFFDIVNRDRNRQPAE
jgi:hypothetical protein